MYDEDAFRADERIFDMGIPILGICYGMQLMTTHFGGKVERAKDREYGKRTFTLRSQAIYLLDYQPIKLFG